MHPDYDRYLDADLEEGDDGEDQGHGFCFSLTRKEGESSLFVSLLHGITLLGCCATLVFWSVSQYRLRSNNTGFYSGSNAIIFPVHLKILLLLSFALLYWGMVVIVFSLLRISDGILFSFLQGTSFGLKVGIQAGITFLLLSAGIGRRSLRRASFFTVLFFTLTASIFTVSDFYADADDDDKEGFGIDDTMGVTLRLFYHYFIAAVYLFLWLSPARIMFLTRRPAAIVWTRYLALTEVALTASYTLIVFNIDVGYCMFSFVENIVYTLFLCTTAYYSFVLEANFWHGTQMESSRFDCMERLCSMKLSATEQGPSEKANTQNIDAPFQGAVELSNASVAAMCSALDNLERSPARSGGPLVQAGKFFPTLRGPNTLGRRAGGVPLIDFSRLQIFPDRMLGTGSTARVYAGTWCDLPVAIKVLFTVEITPEEIQRTCLEASLLHSLQGASSNVVRLFGVAVLPPSLCVVLELCSEGSLNDVVYKIKEPDVFEKKSSFLLRRSGSGGRTNIRTSSRTSKGSESVFSVRTSIFRGSSGRNSTEENSMTSNPMLDNSDSSPQFLHALPWERRLELAVGACQGVAALVTSLGGLSHNDIKSANFLVHRPEVTPDKNPADFVYEVKIADIEFASKGKTPAHMAGTSSHHGMLTPHWCAPEILSGAAEVSPASDVYALGIVLFEIATRTMPFQSKSNAEVVGLVCDGVRPDFPPTPELEVLNEVTNLELTSRSQFQSIVKRSWSQDPTLRPSAIDIAKELKELRTEFYSRQAARCYLDSEVQQEQAEESKVTQTAESK